MSNSVQVIAFNDEAFYPPYQGIPAGHPIGFRLAVQDEQFIQFQDGVILPWRLIAQYNEL